VDQQTVTKRKIGIGNIIGREAAREQQRKRKNARGRETVGLTLRLKPHIWRALHEQALNEQTNHPDDYRLAAGTASTPGPAVAR
jgi:spore coat polysaccharide biosynthesis protein SpsF (cytidylyltransferase family)